MRLSEHTFRSPVTSAPPKGSVGTETDWLEFCDFELRSGKMLVIDPTLRPVPSDGLLVELPPETYRLEAAVMEFGQDSRISRLRVCIPEGEARRAESIGTTGTDSGQVGICDYPAFAEAWGTDDEVAWAKVEPALWNDFGIVTLGEETGALMPYVASGFGDGEFPVYGLREDETLVGAEIEFIPRSASYPF